MTQFVWSLYFCTADLFDASFIFTFSIFGYCTIFKSIFELLPILQLFVFLGLVVVVFSSFRSNFSVRFCCFFFIILIPFFGSFMRMTLCDKPNEIDGLAQREKKPTAKCVLMVFACDIATVINIIFYYFSFMY